MKIHSKSFMLAFVFALVASFAAGCGGGDTASNFTPLPSDGSPDDGDGDDDGGVVSSTGFYITVNADDDYPIETNLHAFNSFSTGCQIASTVTTPTDLKCLLNIQELDLYLNETRLEVNLAPGMCKYLVEQPYWYYNYKPGDGPATQAASVNGDLQTVTACSVSDGTAWETGTVTGAGTRCAVTEGYFDETGAFNCAYDYSAEGGPACCMGKYSRTLTTTSAGTTTSATSRGSYSGKWGNCGSGPAITGMGNTKLGEKWVVDVRSGIPTMKYTYVPQVLGLNKYTDIPAGIDVNTSAITNAYSANMYGWTDYVAGTHSAATIPTAMSYDTDLDGSDITAPNPSYMFICSDNGRDVKHRIRVYVNEWDTSENFDSYISSSGSTAYTPNLGQSDIEGVNCALTTTVPGVSYCDDLWDWDTISADTLTFPEGYPEEYVEVAQ